ncbi:hypothetical protein THAOC_11735 [Thalassiosira oceanica]|uniref:FAD-binding PCMH-type domain-containing protein n=1 Tax=Thalassiosira oceanica TaxID=159749 RepID=K0SPN0_THAOC|nr:hypothetical protein THAOC_11735 [Thalassiosira oceanica]|eukprot:EJK67260.1 hypothetical protein THAOC_11735 [Thalassiosira oceanica]
MRRRRLSSSPFPFSSAFAPRRKSPPGDSRILKVVAGFRRRRRGPHGVCTLQRIHRKRDASLPPATQVGRLESGRKVADEDKVSSRAPSSVFKEALRLRQSYFAFERSVSISRRCDNMRLEAYSFDMKTFTSSSAALAVGVFAGAAIRPSEAISRVDWDDLSSMLSDPDSLKDTSPSSFVEECLPEFEKPQSDRSNWNLIDQPSGVCTSDAFRGFVDCWPVSDAVYSEMFQPPPWATTVDDLDPGLKEAMYDVDNPAFNVPSKVLHPLVASDAVAAVKFAAKHRLMISVKTSGHSYLGSSMRSNSLLLNTRQYERYSAEGIKRCDATDSQHMSDEYSDDLSDQPCRLAVARGKPGVIKVGGGENFGEVYLSVREYNLENDFPFHVIGGAAATVSPQGWTWQSGLAGNTGGRANGFGADQVLQIEMVIASGHHIKFGPTEWEEVDGGGAFPKTSKVSGVCNVEGEWKECDDDIPFEDLWFAMRGGGGGRILGFRRLVARLTYLNLVPLLSGWGIVLAVYLQLHAYAALEYIETENCPGLGVAAFLSGSLDPILSEIAQTFFYKFASDPTSLGFSEEQGRACGRTPPVAGYFCYDFGRDFGDNPGELVIGQAVTDAWADYMQEVLPSLGYNSTSIEEIKACLTTIQSEDYVSFADNLFGTTPDGKPSESPLPTFQTMNGFNVLIPESFMLENVDVVQSLGQYIYPNPNYMAFGGATSVITDDQMNAVPDAHRGAGTMIMAALFDDDFFANIFPRLYDTSDKNNFPGFLGSNHATPLAQGPLKDDWTKACPPEWTALQRQEKCISVQEAVYGTKLLAKLEAIKEAVDPAGMFTCEYCIGDKSAKRGELKRGKAKTSKKSKAKTSKESKAKSSKNGTGIFA